MTNSTEDEVNTKANQGLCVRHLINMRIILYKFLEEKQDVEITQYWLCPRNNNYPENIAK